MRWVKQGFQPLTEIPILSRCSSPGPAPKDRRLSNFDQFFVGLAITVSELDGGSRNGDPIDLFWQINPQEMLSGLMVAAFVILLDTAIVVVCSMVTFPLIDLVFKKKSKPAPAHVET
ncbi:MAG: hypothetical protein WA717_11925 [Methyloceanibacter sp.]